MGLQSFGICPHCENRIEVTNGQHGIFTCPICDCQFKHYRLKWLIAVPLVIAVAIAEYYYRGKVGMGAVMAAVGAVAGITKYLPDYTITQNGVDTDQLPPSEHVPEPEKKESLWFILFLSILLITIAVIFYLSIVGV